MFTQMCLRWTQTSWRTRRNTKPSKEVRVCKNIQQSNQLSPIPPFNQSAFTPGQRSWMRAAATQGKTETAAATMKTMKKRTQSQQKVRHNC